MRLILPVTLCVIAFGCRPFGSGSRLQDAKVAQLESIPWGGEKGGLRTGLWERKNSLSKGRLILLTLALSNTSDKPIYYDAQAAGCNDSLLVKDSKGNIVPYRAGMVLHHWRGSHLATRRQPSIVL
jgi:hypothetical protein